MYTPPKPVDEADKTIERKIVEEIVEIFPMMHERFVRRFEREQSFTQLQVAAMDMLRLEGPKSMKQISDTLRMSKQQLTRFINVLVNRGLMHRFQQEGNRRTIYVELTDEGLKQLGEFTQSKMEERVESIMNLSAEDKERLYVASKEFRGILQKVWKRDEI
jgi:DNA-binding MarR family transcriptional regulator